jgi:hypothetical protein
VTTTTIGGGTTTLPPVTTTTIGGGTTTLPPVTTTTIGGSAECPTSAELTVVAGTGNTCANNGDCAVGTCNTTLGRCHTVTELDSGWTGIAHDADVTDGIVALADITCGTGPVCGQCDIAGINPEPRNCRCANDNTKICNLPFEVDATSCGAGITCNCYVGPPLALSAGNTPACIVNRLATDISGTVNVDEGSGETNLDLRSQVFLGEALNVPCPVCGGTCTAVPGSYDHVLLRLGLRYELPCRRRRVRQLRRHQSTTA